MTGYTVHQNDLRPKARKAAIVYDAGTGTYALNRAFMRHWWWYRYFQLLFWGSLIAVVAGSLHETTVSQVNWAFGVEMAALYAGLAMVLWHSAWYQVRFTKRRVQAALLLEQGHKFAASRKGNPVLTVIWVATGILFLRSIFKALK